MTCGSEPPLSGCSSTSASASPSLSACGNIYDELFTTHADFLLDLVLKYSAVIQASSLVCESAQESFVSVLLDVLHMLLEDQRLLGLNSAQSNGFPCPSPLAQAPGAEGGGDVLVTATKTATVGMFCLLATQDQAQAQGSSSSSRHSASFARYYSRSVHSMRLNAELVEIALASFAVVADNSVPHSLFCETETEETVRMADTDTKMMMFIIVKAYK